MANELLLMGAKKTAHEVLFKISDSKKTKRSCANRKFWSDMKFFDPIYFL